MTTTTTAAVVAAAAAAAAASVIATPYTSGMCFVLLNTSRNKV